MVKAKRHHSADAAVLSIRDLHVYYGQSHALQGVDLTLQQGVHAVIGRNGMGKTTLCNTIMGLLPARRGSIRFHGEQLLGLASYKIAAKGIGYTPQGRRLWPSLSVNEHLRLAEKTSGSWSIERIYDTFGRLAERRHNGAGQLSGGEQQMLAISRALLQDPQLLILDEPTEGLAPVIVEQLERLIADLVAASKVAILLIEQNIALATAISDDVAIMVNGRIDRVMPSAQLANDRTLQERLLGVGRHAHDATQQSEPDSSDAEFSSARHADVSHTDASSADASNPDHLHTGTLQGPGIVAPDANQAEANLSRDAQSARVYVPPTRWSNASWARVEAVDVGKRADVMPESVPLRPFDAVPEPLYRVPPVRFDPAKLGDEVYVVGTFDTKAAELGYIREQIAANNVRVRTVDLSTSGKPSAADVPAHMVASYHQGGVDAVFTHERGSSVRAMAAAFDAWLQHQHGIGGIISAGGSGGTALATPAMRSLPIGVPKLMISTLASGDVSEYVGPVDIMMLYSVTDVQGLNQISRQVLANGANAIAGMVKGMRSGVRNSAVTNPGSSDAMRRPEASKPALGLTMFGVTTQAVQQITSQLDDRYDCLVFHATGTGGRSMEKLADNGVLHAAVDLTTTEVCDMMMGGFFAADKDRFGAFIRTRIPYIGSVGALDMVNFLAPDTVPDQYKNRKFVEHNPQVTLMRTTAEENARMGDWIARRLNEMTGPVRFLIPEGGVSALDAPGQDFYDPAADNALFDAISARFDGSANRQLIRTPHHINDLAFTQVVIDALDEIDPAKRSIARGSN